MNAAEDHLYSHDPRARMITIPEMEALIKDAEDCGPIMGPDTKLYQKDGRYYRVIMPCLGCLGKMEYDNDSPIVEVLEMDIDELIY